MIIPCPHINPQLLLTGVSTSLRHLFAPSAILKGDFECNRDFSPTIGNSVIILSRALPEFIGAAGDCVALRPGSYPAVRSVDVLSVLLTRNICPRLCCVGSLAGSQETQGH